MIEKNNSTGGQSVPFPIIFTDLDGTLLDHQTYGWQEALPALNLCKRLEVPIILVSSKTRAEMDKIRIKLSIVAPFISENGGGIFFPNEIAGNPPAGASLDGDLWKLSVGLSYDLLINELKEIQNELGLNIKGFSDMSIEEISKLTGLDLEDSQLAAMREFDEPFIIQEKGSVDRQALLKAARQRGLGITEGGRFFHLQGNNNKGLAVEKVASWYKKLLGNIFSVALGDSPNDFSMLERTDCPILVKSHKDFSELKKNIPRLKITREIGPKGWNSAVLEVLNNIGILENIPLTPSI